MPRLNPRALEISRRDTGDNSGQNNRVIPPHLVEATERIKPWRWQKGQCPNPGGRPKRDVAAEIARATFEKNPETIYQGLAKRLVGGDPYAFKELAERGYGKLTDKVELTSTDAIAELLAKARKRSE